ncbi:MAG: phosphomannomutase/phosphoglucomutase [Candidatus Gracilibacteria bacterium]|jgi:phosphomannomutase/phosphoglucomutase|nr:phosphomannomutase/phosphoglucomutase [Candidatus Gracilibacteria bacterium]
MNKSIFRTYDIRGIAETDITNEDAYLIGKASATHLIKKFGAKKISIGADSRISSPRIKEHIIKGVLETGLDIVDIGLSTSPMLYWSICSLKLDGGIMITASHNPKEYNGFKICKKDADTVHGEELQEVYELIEKNDFTNSENKGTLEEKDINEAYTNDLISKVNIGRPLKIVVDTGNGACGPSAKMLFDKLKLETQYLFLEPDGTFPNHPADPEKRANMVQLIDKVLETKSDLGIGFDGDGDRVGIVDEKGNHYSADFLLYILARDLTTRIRNPKVVFDTKVSKAIINAMEKAGVNPIMYKTGHSLIVEKMKEIDAPFAGEVSGHMFFAENYYGFDDAYLAAIKILEILARHMRPFSEMFEDIEKTITTEEIKIPCDDEKKFEIVQKIVDHFTKQYDCITIDGVRIEFDEIAWALIRASNTSPNLTLRFEAKNEEQMKAIKEVVYEHLKTYKELTV